jgi:archaemetzincin
MQMAKRAIIIVPVGQVEGDVLRSVSSFVGRYFSKFGIVVRTSKSLPERIFFMAFNPLRHQYRAVYFLEPLMEVRVNEKAIAALGVTNFDLYEAGLNFVFGIASRNLRTAVISLYRLRPEFYGYPPDRRLLIERAIKEAMHELGHVFGLEHCSNPKCVMHFSNSVLETDFKGATYCTECERKLAKNLGVFL